MKTILLPTDFSENALNAIKYAIGLYQDENCEFVLLHTYEVNGFIEGSKFEAPPVAEKLLEAKEVANQKLEKLKDQLSVLNNNKGQRFIKVSKNQSIIDGINEELKNRNIEIIVIGTQGATGRYELEFGSNTKAVMEHIKNCPILAIPRNERFNGLNEIVFANGFKLKNEPDDLRFLISLSKKFKTPIRVLNISETGGLSPEQEENQKILKGILSETEHSFHMLEHVSVPVGIYCFSESRNSDMISFINKKYTFIEKLLFKPLYKNLGNYAKIPVLVMHRTKTH